MPGFAGRQVRIPLKREVADHKGIFGKGTVLFFGSGGDIRIPLRRSVLV
jgi:hypothetical protein